MTERASIHIAVYHPDAAEQTQWVAALRRALPAQFDVSERAAPNTRYAAVWSPPEDFFERASKLNACFGIAAGVDHLLYHAGLPDGLPIYRLEDAGMGDQMARHCRHETEHYRLMHYRYEQQQRDTQWTEYRPVDPPDMPIGVLGFGVLGQQVARTLLADGYPVSAFRRSSKGTNETHGVHMYSGAEQWPAFLAASQVLILIAPLTADTRHIVNAQALQSLPANAYLINVGRGGLVDDAALLQAIRAGKLAGASLDVFQTEPLPASDPYWKEPGVRITPHISALTRIEPSAEQIAKSIFQLEAGGQPGGLVDRQLGY